MSEESWSSRRVGKAGTLSGRWNALRDGFARRFPPCGFEKPPERTRLAVVELQ